MEHLTIKQKKDRHFEGGMTWAVYKYILSFMGGGGSSYDSDAEAFFTAGSITDTTEKNAVNQFVLDLKTGTVNGNDLWTDIYTGGAVWPISPTSLAASAINLRSPSTFDLTMVADPTHGAGGVTFNGSSQYANTGINASTDVSVNDNSMSVYMANDVDGVEVHGVRSGTIYYQIVANNSGAFTGRNMVLTGNGLSGAVSTGAGLFTVTRTASDASEIFHVATSIDTIGTASGTAPNYDIYLGARNNADTADVFVGNEIRLGAIGKGMSLSQIQDFSAAVTTYQTALSRNV